MAVSKIHLSQNTLIHVYNMYVVHSAVYNHHIKRCGAVYIAMYVTFCVQKLSWCVKSMLQFRYVHLFPSISSLVIDQSLYLSRVVVISLLIP